MAGITLIGLKEKGLRTLFEERILLYRQCADYILPCSGKSEIDIIKLVCYYLKQFEL